MQPLLRFHILSSNPPFYFTLQLANLSTLCHFCLFVSESAASWMNADCILYAILWFWLGRSFLISGLVSNTNETALFSSCSLMMFLSRCSFCICMPPGYDGLQNMLLGLCSIKFQLYFLTSISFLLCLKLNYS